MIFPIYALNSPFDGRLTLGEDLVDEDRPVGPGGVLHALLDHVGGEFVLRQREHFRLHGVDDRGLVLLQFDMSVIIPLQSSTYLLSIEDLSVLFKISRYQLTLFDEHACTLVL